ncbi:uncharacterized protein LOC144922351 [Branchiostoma floridae x Branchiostoma belcheri]
MEQGVAETSDAVCKTYHPTLSGGLLTVACTSYYPFFCKRPVLNTCPNSCSNHGRCEGQTCVCQRGWEKEDCSRHNCRDRNDCGEFGTCVGPNICRCRNGWQGRACTVSYCNRFTSCKSCTREVGCGWCEERQSCESGLYRGPDVFPCKSWFYHSCFTVGQRNRCSEDIEASISWHLKQDSTVVEDSAGLHCFDSTTLPTTERATLTKGHEVKTPFDRSTPISTTEKYGRITTEVPIIVKARSFRGIVKIVNREWKDELTDKTSQEFKTLAAEVEQELEGVFSSSNIGNTYDSVEVVGFSRGSIKVDFLVRFNSPTPIASGAVLNVLSGMTDIGGLRTDGTATSITEVNVDGEVNNLGVWFQNPVYILVICVGAVAIFIATVVLVIRFTSKARARRRKYALPDQNERLSENAQRYTLDPQASV